MYDFWAKRWSEGQIGFHEAVPNDLLTTHFARLETPSRARFLLPLSGKARDLRWLAERGHEVVGVEFVADAAAAFFEEWKVEPRRSQLGGKPALSANGVTLVMSDMLEVTPDALGRFDVIYDRAALVALEPATRTAYVETCRALLADRGVTFLITFAYDQTKVPGPPWSVDAATVRTLYAGRPIETLQTRAVPTSARLAAAGVASFEESAYLIG